jgi:LysM repeat protein
LVAWFELLVVRFAGGIAVSSLRPLITITLLAAVGVLLYMKINEKEPVVPAGVGEWTAGPLEVGGAEADANGQVTKPPAYAEDAAPAFVPSAPAATTSTSPGDVAPAWPATTVASNPAPAPAANADSSPTARSADPVAQVPDLPPIPGTESDKEKDAAAKSAATDAAPPATADAAPAAPPKADSPSTEAKVAAAAGAAVAGAAAAEVVAKNNPPGDPITPTAPTADPASPTTATKAQYATARVEVQAALGRGDLAEALTLLSQWYDDPALTADEQKEVEMLLGQLAGSVIYEGPPAHRLEKAYTVQAGETLQQIADKYNVPMQLLAKINGIADPSKLQAGQELKVVRGPFSAIVDLSERKMTLMLDRRYAGKFPIEIDPTATIEEGQWQVDQKLLTPGGGGLYAQAAGGGEDRSLLLVNAAKAATQTILVRGPGNDLASGQPASRIIRLKAGDVSDLYDILSEKSRITVRK